MEICGFKICDHLTCDWPCHQGGHENRNYDCLKCRENQKVNLTQYFINHMEIIEKVI